MKLRTKENINAFVAFLVLIAVLYAIDARAGDKIYQDTEVHTQATAGGGMGEANNDLDIAGDKTESFGLGVAVSLGGAAIGDCVITKQDSYVVYAKQRGSLNRWCASLYFDQIGQHKTAAMMRCSISRVRELFDSRQECVAGNTFVAPQSKVSIDDALHYLVIRQDALAEAHTKPLEDEVEKLRRELQEVEKSHQRPVSKPQTIIQQQPFLDQAKRDALAAIRGDQ